MHNIYSSFLFFIELKSIKVSILKFYINLDYKKKIEIRNESEGFFRHIPCIIIIPPTTIVLEAYFKIHGYSKIIFASCKRREKTPHSVDFAESFISLTGCNSWQRSKKHDLHLFQNILYQNNLGRKEDMNSVAYFEGVLVEISVIQIMYGRSIGIVSVIRISSVTHIK